MPESYSLEIAKQLKAAGRFDDFKARREQLTAELGNPSDAYDAAVIEFGLSHLLPESRRPKPPTTETVDPSSDDFGTDIDLDAISGGSTSTAVEMMRWVSLRMTARLRPEDCPDPAHYSLWHWGHDARSKFWELFMRYVGKSEEANPEEAANEAIDRKEYRDLEKLLCEVTGGPSINLELPDAQLIASAARRGNPDKGESAALATLDDEIAKARHLTSA